MTLEGYLLVGKPSGITSFSIIHKLRKKTGVQKIGHAGTLDPFAEGLMIVLVGRRFTRLADHFMQRDKEYLAALVLGASTDTHDHTGKICTQSAIIPTRREIDAVVGKFQGSLEQIPPMYSAKKVGGKRLYDFARRGREIPRLPCQVFVESKIIRYDYPELELDISCSKGTYIRTLADDMGKMAGCGAYVNKLTRVRSGKFSLNDATPLEKLLDPDVAICDYLRQDVDDLP
jgi:tRNA pseudouridine55 synthase